MQVRREQKGISTFAVLIRRQPLAAYFALSIGISWALWAPLIAFGDITLRLGFGVALLVLGVFGPTIAALAVTFVSEGAEGVERLLRKALVWRLAPRWYIVAALGPIMLMVIAIGLGGIVSGEPVDPARFANLYLLLPVFFGVFFCGPLEQELGWRGYALPRLQERHSVLTSALLSGVMWGLWHVPLFWTPGAPQQMSAQGEPLPLALIATAVLYDTSLTVLFAWLFNRTGGSILIAFIFHTSIDAAVLTPVILGLTDVPLSEDSPIFLLFLGLVLVWVACLLVAGALKSRPHERRSTPQGAN